MVRRHARSRRHSAAISVLAAEGASPQRAYFDATSTMVGEPTYVNTRVALGEHSAKEYGVRTAKAPCSLQQAARLRRATRDRSPNS